MVKITFFNFIFVKKYISLLVFGFVFFLMLVLSVTKESILPDYFFIDADTIQMYIKSGVYFLPSDSFANTAYIYNFFGVERHSFIFPLFSSSYVFFVFYRSLRISQRNVSLSLFVLFVIFCLFSVVYLTVLSKDFIVFVLMSILILFDGRKKLVFCLWFFISLIYAYTFRKYWFIFLFEFVFLYFIYVYIYKFRLFLILFFVSFFFLSFVLFWKLGVSADYYRMIVNDYRLDNATEVNTMILPFFSGGDIISTLNVILVFFSLFFPFPLLFKFSFYYFIIFLLISLIMTMFLRSILFSFKNKTKDAYVFILVLSFLFTQSFFEPDYGSYLRHIVPFCPLIFYYVLKLSGLPVVHLQGKAKV